MWVSKRYFDKVVTDNERLQKEAEFERIGASRMSASLLEVKAQKAKDDMTIDWMRHRVNELTKQNTILMAKATGVNFPVPEIVPTRPGTMTMPDFSSMPSFEDMGDSEAQRLGVMHDELGAAVYSK